MCFCPRLPAPGLLHAQAFRSLGLLRLMEEESEERVACWPGPQQRPADVHRGGPAGLGAAVGLDDVLDGAAADGAAGVQGLLEAQAAGVAEAHVTARVDDRVHRVLIANGALVTPLAHARGHWRLRQAHRRVGGCPWAQRARVRSRRGWAWHRVHGKGGPGLLCPNPFTETCLFNPATQLPAHGVTLNAGQPHFWTTQPPGPGPGKP